MEVCDRRRTWQLGHEIKLLTDDAVFQLWWCIHINSHLLAASTL